MRSGIIGYSNHPFSITANNALRVARLLEPVLGRRRGDMLPSSSQGQWRVKQLMYGIGLCGVKNTETWRKHRMNMHWNQTPSCCVAHWSITSTICKSGVLFKHKEPDIIFIKKVLCFLVIQYSSTIATCDIFQCHGCHLVEGEQCNMCTWSTATNCTTNCNVFEWC